MGESLKHKLSADSLFGYDAPPSKRKHIANPNEPTRQVNAISPNVPASSVVTLGFNIDGGGRLGTRCSSHDAVSISVLPCEVLEYIFAFLDLKQRIEIELVCKQWRRIGKERPWRWPKKLAVGYGSARYKTPGIDLNSFLNDEICDDDLSALLCRCGRCLKQLALLQHIPSSWNSDKSLQIVCDFCPNLEEIVLGYFPSNISLGLNGCAKLKSVWLRHQCVVDKDIMVLLNGCEILESLKISAPYRGNQITGECLSVFNNNLKTLHLMKCTLLKNSGLDILMTRCNTLQDLRITHCYKVDWSTLNECICHYAKTLTSLFLDGNVIKDTDLCSALCSMCHLEKLSLHSCHNLTNDICQYLSIHCLRLKFLNISITNISDEGISYLTPLPCLVELGIMSLTLKGFGIEDLAAERHLERVYANCVQGLTCANKTYELLASLCPNLNTLDVSINKNVSNLLVESLGKLLKSGQLKGPLKLGLVMTSVDEDIQVPQGLELFFEVLPIYCNDYDLLGDSDLVGPVQPFDPDNPVLHDNDDLYDDNEAAYDDDEEIDVDNEVPYDDEEEEIDDGEEEQHDNDDDELDDDDDELYDSDQEDQEQMNAFLIKSMLGLYENR